MLRQVQGLIAGTAVLVAGAGCPDSAPAGPARNYQLTTRVAEPVRVGPSELEALVTASPGYHLNETYPINFRPDGSSAGVTFASPRFDFKRSTEATLEAKVPFAITTGGPQRVSGLLAFSVCDADKCAIEKVPISVALDAR